MNNYEGYQLEDMENDNKSALKKAGLAGGAAVLGGGAVYAGSQFIDSDNDALTEEDILALAEAGEVTDEALEDAPAPKQETVVIKEEVHVHRAQPAAESVERPVTPEPVPVVNETNVVIDEEGNYLRTVDSGIYDGREFAIVDIDGDNSGDFLAFDENANGIFEEHEITELEKGSYTMGQGKEQAVVVMNDDGQVVSRYTMDEIRDAYHAQDQHFAQEENHNGDEIVNDYPEDHNEKDYAYNNPDYRNNEQHSYSASTDNVYTQEEVEPVDYDQPSEPIYTDELTAYENPEPSYTDPAVEAAEFNTYGEQETFNDPDPGYTASPELGLGDGDPIDSADSYDGDFDYLA